jgi:hypothetical protein
MRLNVTSFQPIVCSHFFLTPNYATVCSTAACTTRNFLCLTSTVWFTSAILKTNCERSAMVKHGKATGQCECNALSSARDKFGLQHAAQTPAIVWMSRHLWLGTFKAILQWYLQEPTFPSEPKYNTIVHWCFHSTQYCSCCTTLSL